MRLLPTLTEYVHLLRIPELANINTELRIPRQHRRKSFDDRRFLLGRVL